MEQEKSRSEKWSDGAENLIETYRDLITVRIVEHSSLGASVSILGILSLMFILCIALFIGLGIAWWIGEEMGNRIAGFFIVGGGYFFLLSILLMTAKKFVIPGLRNIIIKKIYEENQ